MWDGPRERPSSRRELEPASYPEPSSPGEARWDRDTADDETSPEPPVPRAEPPRVEPLRAEPPRVEPLRAEPVRAEPPRAEPVRAESPRAEPVRAESPRRASPPVEPEPSGEQPRSRSIFRRIAFYARIAVLVLAAGLLAYAYATSGFDLTRLASDIDLSWLTASPNAASPQRAVLYDVRPGDRKAAPLVGKATWRTRTQASDGSGNPETVLALDAEIPERQLAMTMTIARETETGGGMSHTFEIGFARPDQVPFGGISGVSKIVMKGAETELGDDLIGTSITVGPGNYLFGLLDTPDALRRNVELLRTRPWLGVLIVFGDGQAQMLNVEKGASGQRAIDDALAKWGQ